MKTSFAIEERYETNYLKSPKGSEVDDYVSVFKPGLSLEQDWKKLSLTFSYLADIEKVARNSNRDYTAHALSLDMKATPWAKTSMALAENVSYSPNVFDTTPLSNTNVITAQFTNIFYNSTYATLSQKFTESTYATLHGEYALQDFSDPSLVDTISNRAGITVGYDVLPLWSMFADYEYSRYSFARGNGGISEVHLATLGLKGTFPKGLIVVSGGAAYTPGVKSSSDIVTDTKWVAGALLRRNFRKSSFSIEYTRGISNTGGISTELSINDTVTMTTVSNISDDLSLLFTGIYAKQRSAPNSLLDTTYYSAELSGNWRINRRFSLSAGYTHYEQLAKDSSLADDIKGEIVFLRLSTLIYENRF